MNRRGFLGSLVAVAVAPFVPTPKRPSVLVDKEIGIAIRFIRRWDVVADRLPTRFDWPPNYVRVGDTIHVKLPERYRVAEYSRGESVIYPKSYGPGSYVK